MDKVTEIIQQTATAVMSEVVQQLVPAIMQIVQTPAPAQIPSTEKTRRRHKPMPSIIGTLDTELREEAEDMILSNRYTYADIAAHFSERYGIRVSKSAVGRYAQQLYAQGIEY